MYGYPAQIQKGPRGNPLFHHPDDTWSNVVDLAATFSFIGGGY